MTNNMVATLLYTGMSVMVAFTVLVVVATVLFVFDETADNRMDAVPTGALIQMTDRDNTQPRYGTINSSRQDHIARLRKRLDRGPLDNTALANIMKGMLDLLADEQP